MGENNNSNCQKADFPTFTGSPGGKIPQEGLSLCVSPGSVLRLDQEPEGSPTAKERKVWKTPATRLCVGRQLWELGCQL